MIFKKLLQEVFSDKELNTITAYSKKKVQDAGYVPEIIKNGLNDVNPDGTLKKRKKGEIR